MHQNNQVNPQRDEQPQVVTIQPQVAVGQQAQTVASRNWSNDLFSCCSDSGEFCCGPCYACKIASRAGESCFAMCFGGPVPLRTKIRTERKIAGSIVEDFCVLHLCPCCAMIQMGKEARDTQPLI